MKRDQGRDGGGVRNEAVSGLSVSARERKSLGELRAVHPPGSGTLKLNLFIVSAFTLLLGGAAVAMAINAMLGPPGRGIWGAAALFGGLAVLPAVGVVFIARKLFWRLYLFENGFVFVRGRQRVVVWDDVEALVEGGLNIDRHLTFALESGEQVSLDNSFRNFAKFADAAREAVTRLVLARATERLAKGEGMAFGKLTLSKQGLEYGGKTLPWSDVEYLSIEGRVSGNLTYSALVVWQKGSGRKKDKTEWLERRISKFPTFAAFLELAGRYTEVVAAE